MNIHQNDNHSALPELVATAWCHYCTSRNTAQKSKFETHSGSIHTNGQNTFIFKSVKLTNNRDAQMIIYLSVV